MTYITTTLLLALSYLALTSNLEPLNIIVAVAVGFFVAVLVRPQRGVRSARDFGRSVIATIRYAGILIWDLIVSGIQVAGLVLRPSLPIKPGNVAIPSNFETDLGAALSAHAITLTPGEMVVEMDDDHYLYTHCLDATQAADYVTGAAEMRRELLDEIFP